MLDTVETDAHRSGNPVKVDLALSKVDVKDYDALFLPGGQMNPDALRLEPKAIEQRAAPDVRAPREPAARGRFG